MTSPCDEMILDYVVHHNLTFLFLAAISCRGKIYLYIDKNQ